MTLAPGEVRVWTVPLEGDAKPHREVLDAEERARADRFHFDVHRERYTIAHAALRNILGRLVAEDPAGIRFRMSEYGKPFLPEHAELHFNLSHSADLALVAATRVGPVGVDVEEIRALDDLMGLARRNFSPAELDALVALPAAERQAAFFSCWTRKEAFVKALGEGLSHPLDAFDVSLRPGEPARVLAVRGEDAAEDWWLHDLRTRDGFAAAVAVAGSVKAVYTSPWPS